MTTINFKQFPIPKDITHSEWVEMDLRETFANLIYMNMGGIRAHDLAFNIFHSEGSITYDDADVEIIKHVTEFYGMPRLIDGLQKLIAD